MGGELEYRATNYLNDEPIAPVPGRYDLGPQGITKDWINGLHTRSPRARSFLYEVNSRGNLRMVDGNLFAFLPEEDLIYRGRGSLTLPAYVSESRPGTVIYQAGLVFDDRIEAGRYHGKVTRRNVVMDPLFDNRKGLRYRYVDRYSWNGIRHQRSVYCFG